MHRGTTPPVGDAWRLNDNEYERTMTFTAMYIKWLGSGNRFLLGCLLCFAFLQSTAQNLVPNPSFEDSDTCSLGLGFRFPDQGPHNWFSSWGTPDHLQNCLPYGAANGLPFNAWTFQEPLEGESCIGMFTYHQNGLDQQREWAMVELQEPLAVGQTYYGSFYANAGFGGNLQNPQVWLASSNIGMLFTVHATQWDFSSPNPTYPNRAHIVRPNILADTVSWTMVSGSFVADSAYRFVMIGNFFSNAVTDTMHFTDPSSVFWWAPRGYTLIDRVCVSAAPNVCDMVNGVEQEVIGGVVLFPNPAVGEVWLRSAAEGVGIIQDAIGRRVWEGRITEEEWRLDVSSWARGIYTLQLQRVGGQRSFKFVLVGP
jgi:hypothetical protein